MFVTGQIELVFPTPCEGLLKMTAIKLRNTLPEVVEDEYSDYGNNDYGEPEEDLTLHPKSSAFSKDLQKFDLR